jgi:hypothetical protein
MSSAVLTLCSTPKLQARLCRETKTNGRNRAGPSETLRAHELNEKGQGARLSCKWRECDFDYGHAHSAGTQR